MADLKDRRIAELEKICERLSTKLKATTGATSSSSIASSSTDGGAEQPQHRLLREKADFLHQLIGQAETRRQELDRDIERYKKMKAEVKQQLDRESSAAIAATESSQVPQLYLTGAGDSDSDWSGLATPLTADAATAAVAAVPGPATACTEFEQRKKQLAAFYKAHHSKKVGKIGTLLTAHKFPDVCASLQKTYGDLPRGWSNTARAMALPMDVKLKQLQEYYETQLVKRIASIDMILSSYTFKDVVRSVKRKHGAVPPGWEKELGWFAW
eukprot:g1842.t1